MPRNFALHVSYAQIAVFRAGLPEPFILWTDEQVESGYAWTRESVSFKTPIEAGNCLVEVVESHDRQVPADRSIDVLFTVPEDGLLEIASISDSHQVTMPAGTVTLRYTALEDHKVRLTFIYASMDRQQYS